MAAWVLVLTAPEVYSMMLVMQEISSALSKVEPNSSRMIGNTCMMPLYREGSLIVLNRYSYDILLMHGPRMRGCQE